MSSFHLFIFCLVSNVFYLKHSPKGYFIWVCNLDLAVIFFVLKKSYLLLAFIIYFCVHCQYYCFSSTNVFISKMLLHSHFFPLAACVCVCVCAPFSLFATHLQSEDWHFSSGFENSCPLSLLIFSMLTPGNQSAHVHGFCASSSGFSVLPSFHTSSSLDSFH